MTSPKFVHLHLHSDYSMIDGMANVKKIIGAAAELEMNAIALTDFTNFCGLIKFYSAALAKGIKPIIGADLKIYVPEFDLITSLTVLVKNQTGYKNLTLLISKAYERGYVKDLPVVDKDWLQTYSEGLILLVNFQSDLGVGLLQGNQKLAESSLAFYQTHFGNHFYLELSRTNRLGEAQYLQEALKIATQFQLPIVATNDVRFLKEADFDAHEIRVAIHNGDILEDQNRPKLYTKKQYLRTEDEMLALFVDLPEAIENTVEIAKRCSLTLRLGEYFLPNFPTGTQSTEEFLIEKAKEGLEKRLAFLLPDESIRQVKRVEYDERLEIELKVINQMGFPGYFLIVMEFIQWSKQNQIPVGPGRGSGAGSLVAYALYITDIDPLAFDLLFERFLNPERVSMPDFDIDFCMEKRDLVIDHVAQMYGREAVSQIITFGTMAAKAVIRDVGRVLGYPYSFVDRVAKLIPLDVGMTLEKAFELEPKLNEQYEENEEVKALIDFARQLEGVIRNAGKHAGGVVISPTKITDFSPIYCDSQGHNPITQFDKNDVEYAGLVKFDFLGLRTLTIIDWAVQMINQRLHKEQKEPIDIEKIPLDDQFCFELLLRAETTAIFQLESKGMKDLIRRLKPDCFEDMIALVALFRPGPLQSGMVDNFIDRKQGREAISYPDKNYQHESLKQILDPTYGIILYQEQVMQIAQTLAGYSLGEADLLRRAMGKKQPEEMAKQRSIFKEGAEKQNVDGDLAMKIFDLVEKFAGYGFNKSHSAAYALVSYQTLWLKTHYPAEFMAAVMTADMDNTDKIVSLVDECLRMNLKINPPDINSGQYRFHVNAEGEIVYGIGAIKGIGEAPIEAMIEARKSLGENGYFKNIFELCAKVDVKKMNRRVLEKLTYSGAFDKLGPHRAAILNSLNDALQGAEQHHKAEQMGQSDLFGVLNNEPEAIEQSYKDIPNLPQSLLLEGEKATLGLYLSGHPITPYLNELNRYTGASKISEAAPTGYGKQITFAGIISSPQIRITKKGNRIGLFKLDDRSSTIDVILFGDLLTQYESLLIEDSVVIVSGQVSDDDFNGGLRLTTRQMSSLSQMRAIHLESVVIDLPASKIDRRFLTELSEKIAPFKGGAVPLVLRYRSQNAEVKIPLDVSYRIQAEESLFTELKRWLTNDSIQFEFKKNSD